MLGKLDVDELEQERRDGEYEPWRSVVKDTKVDLGQLTKTGERCAQEVAKEAASMQKLMEVLALNAATTPSRFALDNMPSIGGEPSSPAGSDGGGSGGGEKKKKKKDKTRDKQKGKAGDEQVAVAPEIEADLSECALFKTSDANQVWTNSIYSSLFRCIAAATLFARTWDGMAATFTADICTEMAEVHGKIGTVEMLKRDYWDQILISDRQTGVAKKSAKNLAAVEAKSKANEEKAMKFIAEGKSEKAMKLMKGDTFQMATFEHEKLVKETAQICAKTIDLERIFTNASGALQDQYEHHVMRSLQLHMQSVLDSYRVCVANQLLANAPEDLAVPAFNQLMAANVAASAGSGSIPPSRQVLCRPNVEALFEFPMIGCVGILTDRWLSVLDATSKVVRFEISFGTLLPAMRADEELEKQLQENGVGGLVSCATEAGPHLWLGTTTGHLFGVDSCTGQLAALISLQPYCIMSLATVLNPTSTKYDLWAGSSVGDIVVVQFNSPAMFAGGIEKTLLRPPPEVTETVKMSLAEKAKKKAKDTVRDVAQMANIKEEQLSKGATTQLILSIDGKSVTSVYHKRGYATWNSVSHKPVLEWSETVGVLCASLCGPEVWLGFKDSTVRVLSATSGELLTVLQPYEGGGRVSSIASDSMSVWVVHENHDVRITLNPNPDPSP